MQLCVLVIVTTSLLHILSGELFHCLVIFESNAMGKIMHLLIPVAPHAIEFAVGIGLAPTCGSAIAKESRSLTFIMPYSQTIRFVHEQAIELCTKSCPHACLHATRAHASCVSAAVPSLINALAFHLNNNHTGRPWGLGSAGIEACQCECRQLMYFDVHVRHESTWRTEHVQQSQSIIRHSYRTKLIISGSAGNCRLVPRRRRQNYCVVLSILHRYSLFGCPNDTLQTCS